MTKDILSEGIIGLFKEKMNWKIQTVRDQVSRFKIKECPKCTQNAAAHILALTLGFSCAQKLKKPDKESLPSNLSEIISKYAKTKKEIKTFVGHGKKIERKMKTLKDILVRDAWNNAVVYPHFFILENILRKLILSQLGYNISWWKKPYVTDKIIDYANKIKEDEKEIPWRPPSGNHPIYYVTLKHLSKIIQMNWPKFKRLGEQNSFLIRLGDLFPIRNSLAHNIPVTSRDKKETEISVDKIRKLIKNGYGL